MWEVLSLEFSLHEEPASSLPEPERSTLNAELEPHSSRKGLGFRV